MGAECPVPRQFSYSAGENSSFAARARPSGHACCAKKVAMRATRKCLGINVVGFAKSSMLRKRAETRFTWKLGSNPLESFIQLFARKNQCGGAAMRTVMRILEQMALLQQRGHFLGREPITRLNRGFARDHV